MIKYFKELENPKDFCLPLIDKRDWSWGNKKVMRINLPSDFFNKYRYLLNAIQDVDLLIRSIDLKKITKRLAKKRYFDDFGNGDYNQYQNDYMVLIDLVGIKDNMPEFGEILEIPTAIIPQLQFYSKALWSVMYLCPEIEDMWEKILFQFNNALNDLEDHCIIKYKEKDKIAINVKLPNAWYITPYGDLYNTGGENGHKETNLIYDYATITRSFLENKCLDGNKDGSLKKRLEIIKNGYIDRFDFAHYLNFIYDFPSVQTSKNHHFFDTRCHELRIVKTILGVVSAEAGLYRFFEDVQKYTKDPKCEFDKLIDMTKRDLRDILVRCSGFHKIESTLDKTITTSSPTLFEDFSEYIKRGWDVCFIPPIVVAREEGIVKELDFDSPMVKRYIEKDINKYNECKQKGYGRIY